MRPFSTLHRYMLLKAYYFIIQFRKRAAMKLIKQLKKVCLKVENKMIYIWALHCEKAWSGGISSIQKDMWGESMENKFLFEWDEINANDSNMVVFTFPLPRYPN
ncbi:uncharacterized protein LOC143181695 [Calliopsis andreniformis]|uniref:uncharacterized protein LOC143181695 n=1 Tax=Calliopsis andreniformis TaxID=337506 RepID=UPI003FCE23F9